MTEVLIVSAIAVALLSSLVLARSVSVFAVLAVSVIGISGAGLQFVGTHVAAPRLAVVQWWLVATCGVLLAASWVSGRTIRDRRSLLLLSGTSVLIALAFMASRLLAPAEPAPLSAVGILVERSGAEDNAKWLNVTAKLAMGAPVDAWANVGGPLVLLLGLCATIIGAASFILYGAVNEVAVSAAGLVLAENLLVVLAPLALGPLALATVRAGRGRARVPMPAVLLSALALAAAVGGLLVYGHLTLQYTLLALTVWIGAFLAPVRGFPLRFLATLGFATTATVWFPLNGLAAVSLALLIAWSARGAWRLRGSERRSRVLALVVSVAVGALMVEFLGSSLRYALGVDANASGPVGGTAAGGLATAVQAVNAPTFPLFDDPGGTAQVSAVLGILTAVSLLLAVRVRSRGTELDRQALVPFLPVIGLLAYAAAIAMLDFWATGGGPNYASLKMTYAVTIPILVATLPLAIMAIDAPRPGITVNRAAGLVVVAFLLTTDSLFPRAFAELRPSQWESTADGPRWAPAEVRDTGDQPLATNPIACVYLPQGAPYPSALPDGQSTYSCTRLLTGVAGQSMEAAVVTEWLLTEWLQNRSLWSSYGQYIGGLPAEVKARQVILLDNDKNVIGLETLQGLVDRYPPELAAP